MARREDDGGYATVTEIHRHDLPRFVPLMLGSSDWVEVQQARVDAFADATGDHQWIHVDPGRAATGRFGSTVAHGYLLVSMIPVMLRQLLRIVDQSWGLNYGLDRVRFTSPVTIGSEIRLTATVETAEIRLDGGVRYRVAVSVDIRGTEKPALAGSIDYVSY